MTTTSETLDIAADLIQKRGWTIGTGWPTAETSDSDPLCLEGGIFAAMGVELDRSGPDPWVKCPAFNAVREYLQYPAGKRLYEYNDELRGLWDGSGGMYWYGGSKEASAAHIIEVLRSAAAVERVKEATLVAAD